jgi:hypothetical protein
MCNPGTHAAPLGLAIPDNGFFQGLAPPGYTTPPLRG